MVYKFTDTMAALISNAFSLSFILFDRLVAYFLEWRVLTNQDAVTYGVPITLEKPLKVENVSSKTFLIYKLIALRLNFSSHYALKIKK